MVATQSETESYYTPLKRIGNIVSGSYFQYPGTAISQPLSDLHQHRNSDSWGNGKNRRYIKILYVFLLNKYKQNTYF